MCPLFFRFQGNSLPQIIWHSKVKLHKIINFFIKLLKTGSVANDKWRQPPV